MAFSLNLQLRTSEVVRALEGAMRARGDDLAGAALAIARVEYPALSDGTYVEQLDLMGREAATRLGDDVGQPDVDTIRAFNEFMYDELGFAGNREQYEDPRNSFLNEVLDRRTGIPISLAVVYMEIARRAGLRVTGVNFPGHFLLRADAGRGHEDLIIDPFHGGALLSEFDCRQLLQQHAGEQAAFDRTLLAPASRHDIVVRMLVNLKRLYVRMRSFPQARFVSTLLLAVDPSATSELRDRGLLAYHLQDFSSALRDLEEYLRLLPKPPDAVDPNPLTSEESDATDESGDDSTRIWEHVKALRKRVASFN